MNIEFSSHETNVILAAFGAAYRDPALPDDAKDQMALVRLKIRNAQAAAAQAAKIALEESKEPGESAPPKPDKPEKPGVKK